MQMDRDLKYLKKDKSLYNIIIYTEPYKSNFFVNF